MKTKITLPLIFALLIFLAASGQNKVASVTGNNSTSVSDIYKAHHENPPAEIISVTDPSFLQPELDRHLDSVYQDEWVSGSWDLKTKNHKYRNSDGWLTEDLYVVKNEGTGIWNNYAHFLYTYNGSDPDYTRVTGEVWTNLSSWLQYQYSHFIRKNKADTTFTKDWNPVKQLFTGGSKLITQYDTLDSITQQVMQKFDTATSDWVNQYKLLRTYVAPHLFSEEIFQAWKGTTSEWVNINRKVDAYDTNNFLASQTEFVWIDTSATWQNSSRTTYINDVLGNILTDTTERWNTITLAWEPYLQTLYYYSPLGWKQSARQGIYNPLTSAFDPYYNTYYFYFTDGNIQSTRGDFWNPITNEWITDYDKELAVNLTDSVQFVKYHDNTTYEITSGLRTAYIYDNKNQLVSILKQSWSLTLNDWLNSQETDYTYYPYKLLETTIDKVWNIAGSAWDNSKRSTNYYSEPFGIHENTTASRVCNFANPLKSGSLITCPEFTIGAGYYLNIFSISGSKIYSVGFTGGSSVAVSPSVPDGFYLLQFTDANGRILSTTKVLINK